MFSVWTFDARGRYCVILVSFMASENRKVGGSATLRCFLALRPGALRGALSRRCALSFCEGLSKWSAEVRHPPGVSRSHGQRELRLQQAFATNPPIGDPKTLPDLKSKPQGCTVRFSGTLQSWGAPPRGLGWSAIGDRSTGIDVGYSYAMMHTSKDGNRLPCPNTGPCWAATSKTEGSNTQNPIFTNNAPGAT